MSGLRFKVGELALFAVARTGDGQHWVGEVVQVIAVGALTRSLAIVDYGVESPDGETGGCYDWQLRKLDPPAEPLSLTRQQPEELTA